MNRLSHSAVEIFKECPKKYSLHYKDKLRSVTTGSALLFGSAIDKAMELGMQQFPNCDKKAMLRKFYDCWTASELNGQKLDLTDTDLVKYSKGDYELDENPWLSLQMKGELMIKAFFNDVLPNIEEVLGTQIEIALQNENGDTVVGFADAVVKWKGYDKPIIMDVKTSGRPYPKNKVLISPQLTLYKHALSEKYNTDIAGYIVFVKTINKNPLKICNKCAHDGSATRHEKCNNEISGKRCNGELTITYHPKVNVQVLIDQIDEKFEDELLNSYDQVNIEMQKENYNENWDSCYNIYGKCQYFEYCRTGDTTGLVNVPSRSETPKK